VTLAALVRERAQRTPDLVAVRSKRLGIWHEVTWAQYWRDVQQAAQVLLQFDVAPGDRVAIVSENRYEWVVVDAATVGVRAVTVGVDPTADPAQTQATLARTRARIVVAENAEQVDKVLAVADRLPGLVHLLYLDDRGVPTQPDQGGWSDRYDDPRLRPWPATPEPGDNGVLRRMDAAEPADAVTVLGTKEVAAADVTRSVEAMAEGITPPPSDADLVLPLVSLADGTARAFTIWLGAAAGVQLHMAESVSTLRRDFREVQPTLLFAPAQVWEHLAADIEQRMAGASRLKRWAWRTWRPAPEPSAIGRLVMHRPLRDRVGLGYLRHAVYTGTVAPEVQTFFASLGVPLARGASWSG
jgi:long-chain acyl-CoA synthetase